jgi:hypothetical protein
MLWGWPFSLWETVVKISLWAAVGAGVVTAIAGFVAGYVGYELSDAIQRQSDEKIAEARKAVANANERIAELNRDTARLAADAESSRAAIAGANARALEAQAELARFKAPRSISETDKPRLISALLPFPGTKVAIYVLGEGPEPNSLAASINDMLIQAHWEALSWNWSGAGAATGIVVLFKPGNEAEVESACNALVGAFNSVHIDSVKQPWPGDWDQFGGMLNGPNPPSPTMAPIRIVIGTKPQ